MGKGMMLERKGRRVEEKPTDAGGSPMCGIKKNMRPTERRAMSANKTNYTIQSGQPGEKKGRKSRKSEGKQ